PSWYDEQDIKDDWRSFRYRAIRALCAHRGGKGIGRLAMETYIWRGNEVVAVRVREQSPSFTAPALTDQGGDGRIGPTETEGAQNGLRRDLRQDRRFVTRHSGANGDSPLHYYA